MKTTLKFILALSVMVTIFSSCTEENVEPVNNNGNVTTETNNKDKW